MKNEKYHDQIQFVHSTDKIQLLNVHTNEMYKCMKFEYELSEKKLCSNKNDFSLLFSLLMLILMNNKFAVYVYIKKCFLTFSLQGLLSHKKCIENFSTQNSTSQCIFLCVFVWENFQHHENDRKTTKFI